MERLTGEAAAYWSRIGYRGPLRPTLEALREICRAHVLAVPFETLDGPEGRYPALDLESIQDKVVTRRCGGACMELNGLLAHRLAEIGFDVTLFAAYVWLPHESRFTVNTDHLLLKIPLDGVDWLVDVAFSHLTQVDPLPFAPGESKQGPWTFRITPTDDGYLFERSGVRSDWTRLYRFTAEPTNLVEFEQVVKQYLTPGTTTPVSRAVMCARSVPGGKITLINEYLTVADEGRETVRRITDAETCRRVLGRIFDGHDHLAERGLRLWRQAAAARAQSERDERP